MKHFYQNIEGFMSERNTMLLDLVIKDIRPNSTWVELGSWTGKSVAYCVVNLINKNKLGKFYAVDTWDGGIELQNDVTTKNLKDIFYNNVSPILDKIEVVQSLSWDAANLFHNESVDFCYVDAGHTYDCVSKDLEAWWPKIKSGSYFGGDDYTKGHPGVQNAVWDFFGPKNIKVRRSGRCWFVKKPMP